ILSVSVSAPAGAVSKAAPSKSSPPPAIRLTILSILVPSHLFFELQVFLDKCLLEPLPIKGDAETGRIRNRYPAILGLGCIGEHLLLDLLGSEMDFSQSAIAEARDVMQAVDAAPTGIGQRLVVSLGKACDPTGFGHAAIVHAVGH